MICTDLDGTYLNSRGKVSAFSQRIWNEVVSDGILVTVATARSPYFVSCALKDHQTGCPIVSLGGAVLFDPMCRNVVGRNHLPTNAVQELLVAGEKRGLAPVLLHVRDDLTEVRQTVEPLSLDTLKFLKSKRQKPTIVAGYQAYDIACQILVATFVGPEAPLLGVFEETKWLRDAGLASYLWERLSDGGVALEFKSKKATKEVGLAQLANLSKFDIGSATVFGDTADDVGMFLAAGHSIAMANADEIAKNSADVVSSYTNDQDAVARHLLSVL